MMLNNFANWRAWIDKNPTNGSIGIPDTSIGVKNISGQNAPINFIQNNNSSKNWSMRTDLSVQLGSGTTEVTPNDYFLDTVISDGNFSNLALAVSASGGSGKIETVFTITGVNSSNATQNITEIAIIKKLYYSNNSSNLVMIMRGLLSEPLSVPSGEGFTINYKWDEA